MTATTKRNEDLFLHTGYGLVARSTRTGRYGKGVVWAVAVVIALVLLLSLKQI